MRQILLLEPYFGGSHKHWLQGLQKTVLAKYRLISLPPRKWKMRMQLSALWFTEQLLQLPEEKRFFHAVLCSSLIDVAVFRALAAQMPGWNNDARILVYFHENQFVYPQQYKDTSLFQFASINFNSALAADGVAFNSRFNADTFYEGCDKYLRAAADMKFDGILDRLRAKSTVLHPGIDFSAIDKKHVKRTSLPINIVWNHRWEHDKNPQEFFQALKYLQKRGVQFQLTLLGQSYRSIPPCFSDAKRRFADNLVHFGFARSYSTYIKLLLESDIVVSTAVHEFYGIAVIEAVRAGCVPVLPNRLSYPELFDEKYLYEQDMLGPKLEQLIADFVPLERKHAQQLTEPFSWSSLQDRYAQWLFNSDPSMH